MDSKSAGTRTGAQIGARQDQIETEHTAPAPMEGHGAYNRGSRVQAAGLEPALALMADAARAVPLPAGEAPISVADYGASQGHNSLAPMGVCLAALRARAGAMRPVCIVHTDLPGNDFSALFATLESDPDSYLRGDPQVFPSAVGRSFFGQILPGASVSLGWSSWAVQWMSQAPCPIGDQVQVAYSRNAAVKAAYAAQAAADWRAFLTARAGELAPGGRLVVLTMATDDDGDFGYADVLAATYGGIEDLVAAQFSRASVFPSMATALEPGPTGGRSAAFLDALEAAMAARLARAPALSLIPLAKMVLVKGAR